jgi:hypothetical protein
MLKAALCLLLCLAIGAGLTYTETRKGDAHFDLWLLGVLALIGIGLAL